MASLPRLAVMGGCGRVGLPLAIGLAEAGYHVAIYDVNKEAGEIVRAGRMPFQEEGADEVLPKVLQSGRLSVADSPLALSDADVIFCAIGTPVDEFMNPTMHRFIAQIETVRPHLRDGQVLALRSTMFPGTAEHLQKLFHEKGPKVDVACCPERVSQGKAYVEMRTLPQVVSAFSESARQQVRSIFEKVGAEVIDLDPLEAELLKLFNNAWRYTSFAIANQFFMIANDYGLDFQRLHQAMTYKYPRGHGMPMSGFAAGPCLYKDTAQLLAFSNNQLALGHAAVLVNEGLPLYVVERLKRRFDLSKMTVGILGLAFKANCDDLRDSLAFKLRKILLLRAREILCSDSQAPPEVILGMTTQVRPEELVTAEELIERSDLIIIGVPHREYADLDFRDKPVIDIWNMLGRGTIL